MWVTLPGKPPIWQRAGWGWGDSRTDSREKGQWIFTIILAPASVTGAAICLLDPWSVRILNTLWQNGRDNVRSTWIWVQRVGSVNASGTLPRSPLLRHWTYPQAFGYFRWFTPPTYFRELPSLNPQEPLHPESFRRGRSGCHVLHPLQGRPVASDWLVGGFKKTQFPSWGAWSSWGWILTLNCSLACRLLLPDSASLSPLLVSPGNTFLIHGLHTILGNPRQFPTRI